jgi:hypothetical protein
MTTTPRTADQPLIAEEREIIGGLEASRGRPLTKEEIHLSLEQARHLGEITDTRGADQAEAWHDQDRHQPTCLRRHRGDHEARLGGV